MRIPQVILATLPACVEGAVLTGVTGSIVGGLDGMNLAVDNGNGATANLALMDLGITVPDTTDVVEMANAGENLQIHYGSEFTGPGTSQITILREFDATVLNFPTTENRVSATFVQEISFTGEGETLSLANSIGTSVAGAPVTNDVSVSVSLVNTTTNMTIFDVSADGTFSALNFPAAAASIPLGTDDFVLVYTSNIDFSAPVNAFGGTAAAEGPLIGTLTGGTWTIPIPEPSSVLLCSFAGLGLLARRR